MTQNDEEAWFAPKRYGYGTGLPISRAGWLVLTLYAGTVALAPLLARYSMWATATIVLAATAAFILICFRKTQGGWRWRCGGLPR